MRAYLLVSALLVTTAGAPDETQPKGIERVAWLEGCWEMVSPQRTVEEQWMAPRGGSMLGMSRTVREGKLVEYELVVLREEEDRLAYHAHPSGQASTIFLSNSVSDTMAVFENAEHDFPQRVGYRCVRPDSLLAWIEGTIDGKSRRVEFAYRRTDCP
jgi:hypothetical protein